MSAGDAVLVLFRSDPDPVHGKIATIDINRKYIVLTIANGVEQAGFYLDIKKASLFDD